jgi:hypothetical protein
MAKEKATMSKDRDSASDESRQDASTVVPRWVLNQRRADRDDEALKKRWGPLVREMTERGVNEEVIRGIVGLGEVDFYSLFDPELGGYYE